MIPRILKITKTHLLRTLRRLFLLQILLLITTLPSTAAEPEEEITIIAGDEEEDVFIIGADDSDETMIISGDSTESDQDESGENTAEVTADEEEQSFVITGERENTDPRSVSSQVTVITQEEIEVVAARNVAEVLASTVGVQVQRYGGITEPAMVSIRGSSPEQVLVLVNGKRLNSAQGGGVDFSTISTADIERIEVVRGGASAVHGENALAGVVNIITKDGAGSKPGGSANISYGSLNTFEFGTRIGGELVPKKADIYMGMNVRSTSGYYTYDDSNAESGIGVRDNADGTTADMSFKLGINPAENFRIATTLQAHDSEKGVPGTIEFPSENARMADQRILSGLSFIWNNPAGRFDVDGAYHRQIRNYADPDDVSGPVDDTHDNSAASAELLWKRSDRASWAVVQSAAGYAFRYDFLDSTALAQGGGGTGSGIVYRYQHSAFIRPEFHFWPFESEKADGGRIGLFPALRYDWNSIDYEADNVHRIDDALTWNVGLLVTPGPKKKIVFKGNAGTSYRSPSFDDMFWPSSAFAVGNPDLEPEEAFIWDAGVAARPWSFLNIEAAYFAHHVTNLIQWNPGPGGQWRPSNVGAARIRGAELELKGLINARPLRGVFELRGNLTFMDAVNLSPGAVYGKKLPRRPQFTSNLVASYIHNRGHYARLEGRYVSLRYQNEANTKHYDPHFILDLTLHAQIVENWYAVAAFKNLLNVSYVDVREYPVPGFEFFLGTGVEF